MEEHVKIGASILADGKFAVVQLAREIALTHHERWDGTGYMESRRGDAIPLAGRIVAVADVFNALMHDRPYKEAWALEDAVGEIARQSGHHFDPDVVSAFLALDHGELLSPVEDYDIDLVPPLKATPAGELT